MKKLIVALLFLFSWHLYGAEALQQPGYSRLVIFGDSLSDTGKMYHKMRGWLPSHPPYAEGRFSNGPVWTDDLIKANPGLEVINESEGGATAVAYNHISANPKYRLINNLDYEITQFLQTNSFRRDDLVILWMGPNDYLAYQWDTEYDARRVVQAIFDAVNRITINGGRQVLLFNLPDLGITPSARSEKIADQETRIARYHNQLLQQTLELLANPNVRLFDISGEFQKMLDHPEGYGLNNTKDACYKGGYWWTPFKLSRSLSAQEAHPELTTDELAAIQGNPLLAQGLKPSGTELMLMSKAPLHCEGYLFWDQVHPTHEVHQHIAEHVMDYLKQHYLWLKAG
ncbi:SGNH/GDSL hydrolase family protein [Dongshaea marina]|uniref:SGNH/GDSL hydrolase family protein n=1 Tax=Dongshaea marina TaxID=2047966 RepID=UPI000D3E973C|nr:SGNH/GDSL hydrolase family protein [Dongshaea marina]